MVKVTENVFLIQGQDEMIPDSHVYVIGNPATGDLSLVDAGLMGKGRYKVRSLTEEGIPLTAVKRIIMTHTHLDHIGCLPEIKKEIPNAELWVHLLEADPLEAGDDKTVYGMDMFKQMCMMQYRLSPGAFTFTVDRKLEDNETIEIGGSRWQVLHIPGHSMGGIALYDPADKILIPGDVVYADYAIGRFDLHGADPAKLKESLLRLGGLDVKILLPGHNRILKDVPAGYIMETAKQWGPYLR